MKRKIYFTLITLFLLTSCGGSVAENMPPEVAKNMLKLKGYDFTEKDYFQAIKNDDVGGIRTFFDAQINPNARDEKGETALTFAVQHSEFKTVKVLAENANISEQDALGQTPLHLALSNNKEEVFDYLLEKGADVNIGGAKGKLKNQTVMYLAVTRGREDLVQNLLERGADPNIADSEGGIVLAEACIGAAVNPEIIKMLIAKGANVNQKETNGATPLIYIASNNQTAAENRATVIKMLVDAGADKKAKDKTGKTASDWAKTQGNKDVLEMLK